MRRWLGSCAIVAAVIASGLALVVVAPAAPAVAADSTPGSTQYALTQGSMTVAASAPLLCSAETPEGNDDHVFLRRFKPAHYDIPEGPFRVSSVTFGVGKVTTNITLEVEVFAIAKDDTSMTLEELVRLPRVAADGVRNTRARMTVDVGPHQQNTLVTVPLTAFVDDTGKWDVVVAVQRQGGALMEFGMGLSARDQQTKGAYVVAPTCGFDHITPAELVNPVLEPVIFASGETPPPPVPGDRDGDGVADLADACPDAYAHESRTDPAQPGCTLVPVRFHTVTYSNNALFGSLRSHYEWTNSWWDPVIPFRDDICFGHNEVRVWELAGDEQNPELGEQLGEGLLDDEGNFNIELGALAVGAQVVITSEPTLTPYASCVSEPLVETIRGAVFRTVSATYRPGRVSGTVNVVNRPADLGGTCQAGRVQVVTDDPTDPEFPLVLGETVGGDGAFSILIREGEDQRVTPGTKIWVRVRFIDDWGSRYSCLENRSADMTVTYPADTDLVPDDRDACPYVNGPDGSAHPGCPYLDRSVSLTYDRESETLSGEIAVDYPAGSDTSSCSPANVAIRDVGTDLIVAATGTSLSGAFELPVSDLADGTRLVASAAGFLDASDVRREGGSGANNFEGFAYCNAAASAEVVVTRDDDGDDVWGDADLCPSVRGQTGGSHPGCPVVERRVAASYEDGVLSGNVFVVSDVGGSPCSPANRLTVERLWGDGPELLAETTVSGQAGPFEIDVDIPEGARYRVTAEAYFDTGVAQCLSASVIQVSGDTDGDGVLNSVDACDDVAGPASGGPRSGCPELARAVTSSSYEAGVVSGVVAFTDARVPRTACAGEAQTWVEVWRQLSEDEFDVVLLKRGHYLPEDGRFAIELDEELPVGALYRIYVRDGLDSLAGYCGSVFSDPYVVDVDSDGDGVYDAADGCDEVDGPPAAGPRSGCPELAREVTWSSYEAGVVSGVVAFTDARVPGTACAGEAQTWVEVWRQLSEDEFDVVLLERGHYLPEDGRFAIELDEELPVGALYRIYVRDGLDSLAGYCGSVFSQAYAVASPDTDGDSVGDDVDACDDLPGEPDPDPAFTGCPTLSRTVTAHYEDGTIRGLVTAPDSDGCAQVQAISIVRVPALGDVVDLTTLVDGSYSAELALPDGAKFVVKAPRALDATSKGICAAAESEIVVVPAEGPGDADGDELADDVDACPGVAGPAGGQHPGCATLERTLTASYADGAITGQVKVLGPNPAPVGTCLPAQVKAFSVVNGSRVQVGATTTTSMNGSYTIATGGLAAGSSYVVAIDSYLHEDVAVCGAAESAQGQVPTVVDPPGGSVPLEAAAVAPVLSGVKLTKNVIHVVGSRVRPRATKVKLHLNVAATVVVKVKGTSRLTGKKAMARLSKALGAGRSTIKLTGRLGTRRLPPGRYQVSVRATNTVGADTAFAGSLRFRA